MLKTYIVINQYNEVLDIETNLGLLKGLPKEVLSKLNISSAYLSGETEKEIEVVIISGDNVDNISQTVDNLGGKYLNLGYNFGIVTIPVDKIIDLALVPTIQYIEFPKNLYTTDFESNRASCITQISKANGLNGKGTIVGFLDTGIDYTHPAFINADGTTRIEYIYDLSLGGAVYSKAQINEALNTENPYDIVPSRDDVGHGTHVAGIACAGGNISSKYYGVAPESSIIMVKVARGLFTLSTEIMKGIKFLIDKSKELNMPLAINISLSTNDGAHNGSSLLEQYISTVSTLERVTIVIAAGNEGDNNSSTDEYSYPGVYNEVISVGAIDYKKTAARFTDSNKEVDLLAPGVNIVSTYLNNSYAMLSGTSMATPHVTGALALLIEWSTKEFGRRLTEAELYAQLIKNTETLDMARSLQGNGLLFMNPKSVTK